MASCYLARCQNKLVHQVLQPSGFQGLLFGRRINVGVFVNRVELTTSNGIKVVTAYALQPNGTGTRLTQSLEAKAGGFTAKMLLPVVQPRLEQKLTEDLERLREVLSE